MSEKREYQTPRPEVTVEERDGASYMKATCQKGSRCCRRNLANSAVSLPCERWYQEQLRGAAKEMAAILLAIDELAADPMGHGEQYSLLGDRGEERSVSHKRVKGVFEAISRRARSIGIQGRRAVDALYEQIKERGEGAQTDA